MQAVEPIARGRLSFHRHVVRQHGGAGGIHVAACELYRAPGSARDAECRKHILAVNSDVCKHCVRAGCLESCPTGAIIRTEFDTVYVQPDICNGCGYCVINCPFGVIDRLHDDGRAWKCTLCYDRLKEHMEPACAKACPTDSIKFGDWETLRQRRGARAKQLHEQGMKEAYLYGAGAESQPGTEGLNAFFLLVDRPEVYNLPPDPVVPAKKNKDAWRSFAFAAAGLAVAAIG